MPILRGIFGCMLAGVLIPVVTPLKAEPPSVAVTLRHGADGAAASTGKAPTSAISSPQPGFPSSTPPTGPAKVIVKFRRTISASLPTAAFDPTGKTARVPNAAVSEPKLRTLLNKHSVRFLSPLSAAHARLHPQPSGRTAAASAAVVRFPARAARIVPGATAPDLSQIYVLDVGTRSPSELAQIIQSLRADPDVVYAEEDKPARVCYIPDDPHYTNTNAPSPDDLYGLKAIGMAAAWDTTQGQGVLVAVIDTGVDYNHPDISANIWTNSGEIPGNGIDDDNNGFVDDARGWDFVGTDAITPTPDNDPVDVHGHGTHVAGTIAATGDNQIGVVGVAWKSKIMIVRGLDNSGIGYDSDLARAIIYAVDSGADVINASWGGHGHSQTETDAINYAHAHGVVFVAAAGNDSMDAAEFTPANIPNAITVAALTTGNYVAGFSNYGTKIELAAPGEDILSLRSGSEDYVQMSGTSMAAPHVSGVAALILAQHPEYTNEQVRQALRASAGDMLIPGKDIRSGYGRLNAAAALATPAPLGAKIHAPADSSPLSASVVITGTASGPGFARYVVDVGVGKYPDSWTVLRDSNTSVVEGNLGTLDTTVLPDGNYTVRLRAFNGSGAIFSDHVFVPVRYLAFTSPAAPPPSTPSLTKVTKAGTTFAITGSARGPAFSHYTLEWAPGKAATSGWSTSGITLAGNGQAPVEAGTLGSWSLPDLQGYYTLRLTVTNVGFSSTATTVVFAEPSLLSPGWPQYVGAIASQMEPKPMRQADGSTRFLFPGVRVQSKPAFCYSYGLDGSRTTFPLELGTYSQVAVANLDGQPGDEAVVADAFGLKIFSPTLELLRTITCAGYVFWVDQTVLADLDNDGVPEIIAPARDTQSTTGNSHRDSGALCVFKADGTFFSPNYPLRLTSPLSSNGEYGSWHAVQPVAVDLDRDGRKEIVISMESIPQNGYMLRAFNADGTLYTGWTEPSFSDVLPSSLSAGDLDHDGYPELIVGESNFVATRDQIRVIDHTGAVRPGWPWTGPNVGFSGQLEIAIGDLNLDQQLEIVASSKTLLSVLRPDGYAWTAPWEPYETNGNLNTPSPVLIADIDGDGLPEIVTTTARRGPAYWNDDVETLTHLTSYSTLVSYHPNGTVQRTWPIFGLEGQPPSTAVPVVGDFNGDGQTDLAVQISLLLETGPTAGLVNSALTVLTTGTPYHEAANDWGSGMHDPGNLRVANEAPSFTLQPQSQSVSTGRTVTLKAASSGTPIPRFQWRHNGVFLPQATKSTLQLENVSAGNAGIYDVIVTNSVGSATSQAASLTVRNAPVAADFNDDGNPDLLLQNLTTGARTLRLMNGTSTISETVLNPLTNGWTIATTADFNDDGRPDLLLQNPNTGERKLRLMNGTTAGADVSLGSAPVEWSIAAAADFNTDNKSDILWQNTATGERLLWLMNGSTYVSSASLGTVPVEWSIAAAADFSADSKPDILWQNTSTGERLLWLMNGSTYGSSVNLGTVSVDWSIAAAADFNSDGKPDILWQNASTGQCYLWFMDGTSFVSAADLGTLPPGWSLVGVPQQHSLAGTHDFNGDGLADIVWQNTTTGERALWFMNGAAMVGDAPLPTLATAWRYVAATDFNADTDVDILLQNLTTGERKIQLMSGASAGSEVSLGSVSLEWSMTATGDFNADGKPDILWQNTTTGERYLWLMHGTQYAGGASLGTVPLEWSIAAAADFNADGKTDILWENTTTGERYLWLMDGATFISTIDLGTVPPEWSIVAAADFNGDNKPDLLWQNTATGQRYLWYMDGAAFSSAASLGIVPVEWSIAN